MTKIQGTASRVAGAELLTLCVAVEGRILE